MTAALRRVRGVSYANVDRRKNEATVMRRVGTACDRDLVNAVRRVGYTARIIPVETVTLSVANMDCRGCPERVKTALRRVPGVRNVALEGRSVAKVLCDKRRVDQTRLVQAVKRAGFQARTVKAPVRAVRASTSTRTTTTRRTSVAPSRGAPTGR